jgi:hypothetical protein
MAHPPSKITDQDYDRIADMMSTTDKSMYQICKILKLSYSAIVTQVIRDESKYAVITRARRLQAHYIVGEMLSDIEDVRSLMLSPEIDGPTKSAIAAWLRIKTDTVKWIACKYDKHNYGDVASDHPQGHTLIQINSSVPVSGLLAQTDKQPAIVTAVSEPADQEDKDNLT